jgi:hypothetical protein
VIKPPPGFTAVKLTGVATRRPRLSFTVAKGRFSPALRSLTVSLPRGLSFGASGQGVHATVGGRAVRFSVRRHRGALTIRLARTQGKVAVAISAPSISAGRSLARRARGRTPGKVAIGLTATDGRHATTVYDVRIALTA